MTKNRTLSVGFLFDDTLDSSDGVAQYVKTQGSWLSAHGHQVSYIVGQSQTKTWSGGEVISAAHNLKVKWNGNNLSMPIRPDYKTIDKLLSAQHFDVVHVQVPYSPLLAQKVIMRLPADTALVGTFHVFPASKISVIGSKMLRLVYGKSLRRFDAVVSVSAAAAQYARQAFKLKTVILPNVVDVHRFKVKTVPPNQQPTIVFLGRLVERKGCLELLKAFKLLHQKMPSAQLVIAGDGPLRPKLESYVKKNKLNQNVSFLGFIKEETKPALLASADIACFPSLYGESFGIVLIEAMAAGAKVVLGGDNPGYRTVLGDQPELLVNPKDTQAFTSRLESLLSDQARIEALQAWAQAEVGQYDVNVVGRQLLDLYGQVIAKRTPTRHN